jgi:hypothetical protein
LKLLLLLNLFKLIVRKLKQVKISRYAGKTGQCLYEKIMFPNESVIATSETKSTITPLDTDAKYRRFDPWLGHTKYHEYEPRLLRLEARKCVIVKQHGYLHSVVSVS